MLSTVIVTLGAAAGVYLLVLLGARLWLRVDERRAEAGMDAELRALLREARSARSRQERDRARRKLLDHLTRG